MEGGWLTWGQVRREDHVARARLRRNPSKCISRRLHASIPPVWWEGVHCWEGHRSPQGHASICHLGEGRLGASFFIIYFWLYWVFLAECGLSLAAPSRGFSLLGCLGFSLQWFLLLQRTSSRLGLVALWHVGSSWARDWTHVPCIGRRIDNHWTNREALGQGIWEAEFPYKHYWYWKEIVEAEETKIFQCQWRLEKQKSYTYFSYLNFSLSKSVELLEKFIAIHFSQKLSVLWVFFYNIILFGYFYYQVLYRSQIWSVCLFRFAFNDRVGFFGSKNFPPSSGFPNPLNWLCFLE